MDRYGACRAGIHARRLGPLDGASTRVESAIGVISEAVNHDKRGCSREDPAGTSGYST
jgi:hypothetical protein